MVFSTVVISRIEFIGDRRVLGVGGKPKAGYTIHNETRSSNVFSVGHQDSHSQPSRPRRSLAAA